MVPLVLSRGRRLAMAAIYIGTKSKVSRREHAANRDNSNIAPTTVVSTQLPRLRPLHARTTRNPHQRCRLQVEIASIGRRFPPNN